MEPAAVPCYPLHVKYGLAPRFVLNIMKIDIEFEKIRVTIPNENFDLDNAVQLRWPQRGYIANQSI